MKPLVIIEEETLGIEWAAALYESWAADTDPEMDAGYARAAHRLAEMIEMAVRSPEDY